MARFARIVLRNYPHHVTARGNRREPIFFENGDYDIYRALLAEQCAKARVEIWAYCLMPNHVHLILVPRDDEGFVGFRRHPLAGFLLFLLEWPQLHPLVLPQVSHFMQVPLRTTSAFP
jgi:hypothetical protein